MAPQYELNGEALRDLLRSLREGEMGARALQMDDMAVTAQPGGWICVAPGTRGSPLEAALALMQTQIAQKAMHGGVQVGLDHANRLCLLSRFVEAATTDAAQLQDSLRQPLELLASLGNHR